MSTDYVLEVRITTARRGQKFFEWTGVDLVQCRHLMFPNMVNRLEKCDFAGHLWTDKYVRPDMARQLLMMCRAFTIDPEIVKFRLVRKKCCECLRTGSRGLDQNPYPLSSR